jgi:hypothetical protein
MAKTWIVCILALHQVVCGVISNAQDKVTPRQPLRLSCFDQPFLAVEFSTLRRDTFPSLELRLTDPIGRSAGVGRNAPRIPSSQYGRTFISKERPFKSLAAEVCNAIQGDYEVNVTELDAGSQYRFSVAGNDGKTGNLAQSAWVVTSGRRCRYKIRFKFRYNIVSLYWLDDSGATTFEPTCLSLR